MPSCPEPPCGRARRARRTLRELHLKLVKLASYGSQISHVGQIPLSERRRYDNWLSDPQVFKTLLVNAFPPIDPLDGKKANIQSAADLEEVLIKFLAVADNHVKARRSQTSFSARVLRARKVIVK